MASHHHGYDPTNERVTLSRRGRWIGRLVLLAMGAALLVALLTR